MIQVYFFAQLREQLGQSQLCWPCHRQLNLTELKQQLIDQGEPWQLLAEQQVLGAVNQRLSGPDALVQDGDEVAFFPPVTGG